MKTNQSPLTMERLPDLGDQYVRFVIAVGEAVLYDLAVFPRKFTWQDRRTSRAQAVQVGVQLAGLPYPSLQQVKFMALPEAVVWIARLGLNYEALLGALREQGWEEALLSNAAAQAALVAPTTWLQLTDSETLQAIAEETVANLGDVFYDPVPEVDGYDAATLRANVVSTVHEGLLRAYNALGMQVTQAPGPVYPTVYVDPDTLACPACGSTDIQLEGTQAVPVIENWLDGSHQCHDTGAGDWIEAPQVHCCACSLDWQLRSAVAEAATPVAPPAESQPDPRPTAYVSAVLGFRVELDAPIEEAYPEQPDWEPAIDWPHIHTTVFNALRSCSLPFDWELVEVEDVRILNYAAPNE